MTDRIKGLLVTFEGDLREDDAEKYIECIRAIRRVQKVEPYVKGMEDYMMYQQGYNDAMKSFYEWITKGLEKKKHSDQE